MMNLLKLSSEQAASISTNVFIEIVAIYQVSDICSNWKLSI